jgi:hypothetical protein
MPRYRDALPQLGNELFVTDGGLETTLVFHDGMDLPEFAAFVLLDQEGGPDRLRDYYRSYLDIARKHGASFVLESATWRANQDWADKLGYSPDRLAKANGAHIGLMEDLRAEYDSAMHHLVISGCIGPRGDGYVDEGVMTPEGAQDYQLAWTVALRPQGFPLQSHSQWKRTAHCLPAKALGMQSNWSTKRQIIRSPISWSTVPTLRISMA